MPEQPFNALSRRRLRCLAAAVLGLALFVSARAQSAGNSTASGSGDAAAGGGETVVLPTFQVNTNADNGYIAGDTMSASRLNTPALMTPSDTTMITKQFLDDLGVMNIADAEVFLTNSSPAATSQFSFGGDVSFRGLPSIGNNRNYFNAQTNTVLEYITDRLEGARGSNSILYGPTLIGGGVNVLTKSAQFTNFGSVTLRGDAFGSLSDMVDLNAHIADKLAVRVNAVDQDQKNFVAGYFDKTYAVDLTATYRPWRGGEIRVEGELSLRELRNEPNNFTDTASAWTGTPVTGPITTTPAGVSKISTDYLVVSPNWSGILNFNGYGKSTGDSLALLTPDLMGRYRPGLPAAFPALSAKGFKDQPTDDLNFFKQQNFQINLDQALPGGGTVEIAMFRNDAPAYQRNVNFSNSYVDVNAVLPGGAANPEFGKYYSEGTVTFGKPNQYRTDYRAALAYPIKTRWFTQNVTFIADQWSQLYNAQQWIMGRDNGPVVQVNNVANEIVVRRYWDGNPNAGFGLPPLDDGAYQFGWIPTRETYSFSCLHGYSLNSSGSYLRDTLSVIGGIRRDVWSAVDDEIGTAGPTGAPSSISVASQNKEITTRNVGAVWFPESYVGAYAAYQEGFNPSIASYPTLDASTPAAAASRDRGHSLGLRFRLLDGKIVGSLGYYDAKEADRLQPVATTSINQIWSDLGLAQNEITGGAFADYEDTYAYKAHGYEADITASITHNFRLSLNYSVPRTEQENSLPSTLGYFNANIAQWTAGTLPSSGLSTATQTQIANDIATMQGVITNAANNRTINGTYKWRANAFGVYEFSEGVLKGLRLGGGVNLYGEQQVGSPTNLPFQYYYDPAYETFSALAGYATKIFGQKVVLQLNVNNLANYSKPVFTSLTTLNGINYYNAYWWVAPRNFVFSAKYAF